MAQADVAAAQSHQADAAVVQSADMGEVSSRPAPLLCLLLGAPGSGKTLLGSGLRKAFPGLCQASGGDLARLATADEVRSSSPLLNSISRQLSDKRRRKAAARRLVEVVTSVLADGLQSSAEFCGLVADGVRVTDVESFEQAHGTRVVCVLRVDCPRETLLKRLEGRCSRQGDERLGLSDTTDDKGRIEAYLQRAADEEAALRSYFRPEVVHTIDSTQSPEACLCSAKEALRMAAQAAGEEFSKALTRAEASPGLADMDWAAQLRSTVARLDTEVHPDGRLRPRPSTQ